MVMTLLTQSPEIVFDNVSRENVDSSGDHRLICSYLGKRLMVCGIEYAADKRLSAVSVRVAGRVVRVDLTQTGVGYTLKFRELSYEPDRVGSDETMWNRVR